MIRLCQVPVRASWRSMKDDTQTRDSYHHGDLPQTLIRKAAELLEEKGAENFSMREVARRAGVAVAAPAHHFGNAKGLLTAIATCAFERLTAEQIKAAQAVDDPAEKVIALVHTYIDMSARYPGYAAVLFRWDLVDHEDTAHADAATKSFDLLKGTVAMAVPDETPDLQVRHITKSIWAMAHGFVTLSLTGSEEDDDRIAFGVKALLANAHSKKLG